jgi:hypothetical protein
MEIVQTLLCLNVFKEIIICLNDCFRQDFCKESCLMCGYILTCGCCCDEQEESTEIKEEPLIKTSRSI